MANMARDVSPTIAAGQGDSKASAVKHRFEQST
jgi:hypothetical protein